MFYVERGHRYRFRLVNSMSHVCPALLEIENHSMRIISSDSFDLQPVEIDSLISLPGERYDFVIDANQTGGKLRYQQMLYGLLILCNYFITPQTASG